MLENFLEKYFARPMGRVATQRHFLAVRNGMVSTIPLVIVGSFFLIIAFPPFPDSWMTTYSPLIWIKANIGVLLIPFRITLGLIALYASYNIGSSLAQSYKMSTVSGGTLAICAFLLTQHPVVAQTVGDSPQSLGMVLPMATLGGSGIFSGMLTAIFSVEILRIFHKYNLIIKMPDGVPPAVARSFEALLPAVFIIIALTIIVHVLGFDINNEFSKLFTPLKNLINSPSGILLYVFLVCALWWLGIHGDSIIGSLVRPVWLIMLAENADALAANSDKLPNIAPEPFYQWFVWIGGSGSSLGFVFLMMMSKSSHLKQLSKVCILPGLFNINEPVIFGTPVMLNPFLLIPFFLSSLTLAVTTYIAMAADLITRPAILAPWTFPAPIGAYLSTNGSWLAPILVIINIIISMIIYFPFFKMYEKKLVLQEKAAEK